MWKGMVVLYISFFKNTFYDCSYTNIHFRKDILLEGACEWRSPPVLFIKAVFDRLRICIGKSGLSSDLSWLTRAKGQMNLEKSVKASLPPVHLPSIIIKSSVLRLIRSNWEEIFCDVTSFLGSPLYYALWNESKNRHNLAADYCHDRNGGDVDGLAICTVITLPTKVLHPQCGFWTLTVLLWSGRVGFCWQVRQRKCY